MFADRFSTDGGRAANNQLWHRYPGNPIIKPSADSLWAKDWICNEPILRIGDQYVMYMEGKTGPQYRIGLMTADVAGFDGLTWREFPDNPVLDPGPRGYDAVGVLNPGVIFWQGQYLMYYTAISGPPDRICLAFSDDGLHFTKYDKNPLFPGRCSFPIVRDGVVYLFYILYNEDVGYDLHLATSTDGIAFTRHERRPILPRGAPGEWDSFSIVTPLILYEEGIYQLMYAADSDQVDEPRGFGMAFSRDLVNWEKFKGNPFFLPGESGKWDCQAIWCPWVEKHGDRYLMWYCGSATTYVDGLTPQVGLAYLE